MNIHTRTCDCVCCILTYIYFYTCISKSINQSGGGGGVFQTFQKGDNSIKLHVTKKKNTKNGGFC